MPISRKRRTRRSSRPRRTPNTSAGTHARRVSIRSLLETPPDREQLDRIARSLEAGRQGDAAASLAHELSGPVILETPRRYVLQDLIDQGDDAPPWAYSRWCADLAYGSMLMAIDPRTDEAVRLVMATLHLEAAERASDDGEFLNLGTRIAAGDPMAQDIALYEMGGLRDYVLDQAGPGLLTRTDRILDWADKARVGAYEVLGLRGCRLVLRDLSDSRTVEALNVGALSGADAQALVGRLAPIAAEPGLMFTRRPLPVDIQTARRVGEAANGDDPLGWLWALSLARCDGATEGFHLTPCTPYTSDLPLPEYTDGEGESDLESASPRVAELCALGYGPLAANALCVLEVGLLAAEVGDLGAANASPHVMVALATPGVFEAAKTECVGPQTAGAWRVLAGVVPDHCADRLLELAALADAAQRAE
ncbi:MAG: hypothetical protein Q4G67_04830 [Actinomycetia bacterium]|nr:hypothetical protein [Actinomycetes bacterium]